MMNTEEKVIIIRSINPDRPHDDDDDDNSASQRPVLAKLGKKPSDMADETSQSKQWRKPKLFLEIPNRPLEISPQEFVQIDIPPTQTPTPRKVNFFLSPGPSDTRLNGSSGPSSTRAKSSAIRSLLPKLSFKNRSSVNSDLEKAWANIGSTSSATVARDKLSMSRSWSFSRIFTPRIKRTSSMQGPSFANSNPDINHSGSVNVHVNTKEVGRISRSLSVPIVRKEKGIQRTNSFFRVIPSTPRLKEDDSQVSMSTKGDDENDEAGGEDIPEEEAVCRICFVELCEGGETLKMECSCKGELALAHQECAVKWFSIKGNKTCDVCKQDVKNLPVTLLRIQSVANRDVRPNNLSEAEINGYRVWQELPILVIVRKMDTSAIAISVPFSCALGLISSVTSSTMVKRKYVWIYAAIQFTLVVVFAHIFYRLVRVQAVVSILLSTFAGFGVAMSGASILVEVLRWRERRSDIVISQNEISNETTSNPSRAPPPSLIATPSYNSPRLHRADQVDHPLQ
ncbi:hypothetical protein CASFOL_002720 [Castilleja foliolosa]|uniref:RING-CH-type domain-containing protein n=1 Tax=Castilleja foliolosa TaxID=1961234 RepID=A0ABD3EFN7_9LAMI